MSTHPRHWGSAPGIDAICVPAGEGQFPPELGTRKGTKDSLVSGVQGAVLQTATWCPWCPSLRMTEVWPTHRAEGAPWDIHSSGLGARGSEKGI